MFLYTLIKAYLQLPYATIDIYRLQVIGRFAFLANPLLITLTSTPILRTIFSQVFCSIITLRASIPTEYIGLATVKPLKSTAFTLTTLYYSLGLNASLIRPLRRAFFTGLDIIITSPIVLTKGVSNSRLMSFSKSRSSFRVLINFSAF